MAEPDHTGEHMCVKKFLINLKKGLDIIGQRCYTLIIKGKESKTMYRLTHIDSGFEWSFATLAEAIEYLETFERQEEFEIRR